MKQAAGLMIYRRQRDSLEVLLVHPSGNYNRHAPWSIPKGLLDDGETPLDAAIREAREEAGVDIAAPPANEPDNALKDLGHIDYIKSRKRVYAFAVESPPDAKPHPAQWEVDRTEFLPLGEARRVNHPDQRPFLDRLIALLKDA
jgi:predicted NUDIX family NTP pyrophosphohydrolase